MKVTIFLNNKEVEVSEGVSILEAAQEVGIRIPALCFSKETGPIGACRVCVVEVEGAKGLVASCCTPVSDGMRIKTDSEKVINARKVIINLLLSSHSHNCLMCPTANICELQALAAEYGIGSSAYKNRRRFYIPEDISPYVYRDLSKCIMCYRCVKACRDIKGANVYAVSYRGFYTKITVDTDVPINKKVCRDCDICIKACPVGALLQPQKRFEKKRDLPILIKD